MKKILFVFMLLTFVFTLAACGGEDESNQNDQNPPAGQNNDQPSDTSNSDNQDETPGESNLDNEPEPDPEREIAYATVTFFNQNDIAKQFNEALNFDYTNGVIPLGESVTYGVEVVFSGGLLFLNEFNLVIIPGSIDPSFSDIVSISYVNGQITYSGLRAGLGFYRIQLYLGSELIFTSNDFTIAVE